MNKSYDIISPKNRKLSISVTNGHFATSHSHINYYIDITKMKHDHLMAEAAAQEFAKHYTHNISIDAIVCMDGSEVIGSFLAHELAKPDMLSINTGKGIHVIAPEYNSNGQMMFRDNIQPMVERQDVLLLIASVTTGKTIKRAIECIDYYNGRVVDICAIFSVIDSIMDRKINSLFVAKDIPGYQTYSYRDCPFCKEHQKIDALVNSFGYSKL